MSSNGEWAYLGNPPRHKSDPDEGPQVFVPDVKIEQDDSSYVLHACRGYSGSLAVFDLDDRCIGWMPVEVTGHESVKAWMSATRYRFRRENWIDR